MGVAADLPFPDKDVVSIKLGTTVATNALLERKGAKTLFVTSTGFADALRIGDQARPRLFDLNIVRSEPLYTRVIENPARFDATGSEVMALDLLRIPVVAKGSLTQVTSATNPL